MPITYGSFQKQLKLLPLVLHDNGKATIAVRFGFVGEDGVFTATTNQSFDMEADIVSSILDAPPTPGMTRRDDLSFAIYQYLVTHGLVEAGDIS